MENVVLIIHLILALCLIGIVLLQRSEGGMGGLGGGGGGLVSARGAATALGRLTWGFAVAFIATSIALTIIAAEKSGNSSVLDRVTSTPAPVAAPEVPAGDDLLPPPAEEAPATPRAD